MRKRLSNVSEVAHYFANQLQSFGECGNISFSGDTCYSYVWFPIARHVINESGESAVLITTNTYSKTTAKHISEVWSACSHLNTISCYNVKDPNESFKHWNLEATEIIEKLSVTRKPKSWLLRLYELKRRVEKYANFFDLEIPKELQDSFELIYNKESLAKIAAKKKEQTKLENKRKREYEKQKVQDFMEFRIASYNSDYQIVRFNKDSNRFETSKRVQIPFEIGKRFYEKLIAGEVNKYDNILHYFVREVTDNVIKIGCHTFKINYLKKVGEMYFA